jgi:hypothetical protein
LDRSLAEYQLARRQAEEEKALLAESRRQAKAAALALKHLQSVAATVQQKVHAQIEAIVTRCLEAVFDEPLQFRIEFTQKRKRTQAEMLFVKDGEVLKNPTDAVGHGVLDVAAFALRLACVLLSRPPVRPLMLLDEPFRHVRGGENRMRIRSMLEMLAEEFGIQFIVSVDIDSYPEFEHGSIVRLK